METLKGLAEKYAQRDDLYTENGEYTKTTVINAFNDGAKAMLQVIGYSLAAHQHKETKVTTKREREWLIEQINKTNMEVKELKIGNYVKYNESVVSVYAISNQTPNKDKHFDNKARVTLWCNGLIDATIDEIEPIPVTEELLLKIGFKKDVDANNLYRYAIHNCLFEIRLWDSGTFIKLENYCENCVRKVHLPKTPNLHQLQNAYYLVTGKELEIKL